MGMKEKDVEYYQSKLEGLACVLGVWGGGV